MQLATRIWIRQQADIERITAERPPVLRVRYETLCDRPDETLAAIYRFAGVAPQAYGGDFRAVEHHILGNFMRLADIRSIAKDTRWRHELSAAELTAIEGVARAFVQRSPGHPVAETIRHYLG